MSVTKGLLVRFDALPGKEDDVKEFLDSGRALVEEEPATTAWFAIRVGPSSFGTVSYTHLTLPTMSLVCRSRWSPYH